jgi:hypothetical protein
MYKSLTAQSLHYFARPHQGPRREAMDGPAAWRSADMARRSDWTVTLDAAQIAEIAGAIETAIGTGKPTAALERRDFPLRTLAPELAAWRREITHGRGFLVIRGIPVEAWGQAACEVFFFALGLHLGEPGAQNEQGDVLGHVVDTGENVEARTVRRYRTHADIAYHCDAADAVGLLCLKSAKSGGTSRIVSSVAVYNEVLRRRPDLVARLYEPFLLDTHGQRGLDYFPIAPCRHAAGRLRTFFHSDYFRSAQGYEDVPPFDRERRELIDLYEEIAAADELRLDMEFEPGDIQLVSNHTILHARSEYEDHPEPERKRHLLRLWLSLDDDPSLLERALTLRSRVRLVTTLARCRLRRLVRGPSRVRRDP